MAFIIEQAGGRATDGFQRILEMEVESLHQRCSIFVGSENMVRKAEEMMMKYSPEMSLKKEDKGKTVELKTKVAS